MRKNEHQWGWMANEGSNVLGELAQCQISSCRKWRYSSGKGDGKLFRMSNEKYKQLHESGEIDATEVFGLRKK